MIGTTDQFCWLAEACKGLLILLLLHHSSTPRSDCNLSSCCASSSHASHDQVTCLTVSSEALTASAGGFTNAWQSQTVLLTIASSLLPLNAAHRDVSQQHKRMIRWAHDLADG